MSGPYVEASLARRSRLSSIVFLALLAALALGLVSRLPAQAARAVSAAPAPAVREGLREQTPAYVADADRDNGPGMDEAALAKHPGQ